jgi:hypothetical protein
MEKQYMSSMLEQAILDAKELKEAAIKNAQQALIERYSGEFEGEIERLLEQAATDPAAVSAAPAPTDPAAAPAVGGAMPAMPGMATPGTAPVDPEKAKADSDNKSSIFDKLDYAFKDGEVIADKVYPTGVIEIDLDSLSEFGFKHNNQTPEQLALQELKALSKKSKLNEQLDEEMNDDEDYDDESETYPYGGDEDEDEMDDEDLEDDESDEDLEDDEDFDSDADELSDIHDFNDEGSFEDEESDLDDEGDFDVDIEDEDFEDDEDMDEDDLYGTEDDVGFHIDYDSDEDKESERADYNPDADVEDLDDEESDEDEDEEDYDDEESDEEEDDEEEYYSDEQDEEDDSEEDDSEEDDEEDEYDDEEELEEELSKEAENTLQELVDIIQLTIDNIDSKNHPGLSAKLARILHKTKAFKKAAEKKEKIHEAIKLDWKRSGQRSPFTGMFKEEAEHDYELEQLQAQIEELEQEVDSLKESNKKLKSGLKDSIKLNEGLVQKIKNYEQKLHESRILNYKLLYTNKALSDSSLNGQQKDKIAESISNAKTAEEVKLLYETLKSTMRDGSTRSTPKSLSEAVERRSSSLLLRGTRAEPKKQDDIAERMKRLAGL